MTDKTSYPSLKELADITLRNEEGKETKLSEFLGKRVIMFFFPRADTPGCTTQACGFRDEFPRIEAAGATVIGVSTDEPKALAKWKIKHNLPYTLLSDPDHVLQDRFAIYGEKTFMGKKFMGTTRSHIVFNEQGEIEAAEIGIGPKDSVKKGVQVAVKS
jgi:thioredoxin-dependent peroxiredoxin